MMRTSSRIAAVTWCAALTPVLATAQQTLPCRYEIMAIIQGPFCPGWGNAPMFARGLSNHDPPWVTGFYTQCTIGPEKAFVWTGSDAVQTLQFPGVDYSFGLGLNDHGKVVGQYLPNVGGSRGFIYDVAAGTYLTLEPIVPEGGAIVWDINNAGIAVGSRTISQTAYNAFIWKNGEYTDLGVMNGPYSNAQAISENGIVGGWSGTSISAPDARGFLWQNGKVVSIAPIPGGISSAVAGVNNLGDAVGWGRIISPSGTAYVNALLRDRNGELVNLGTVSGYLRSFAFGITDHGVIVGEARSPLTGSGPSSACVWRHRQIANLNELITSNPSLHLFSAHAINHRGEILCEGQTAASQVAVILTPIGAPMGDINLDCHVNVTDLLTVINAWGNTNSPADVNGDGIVNVDDLLIVINNWTF